MNRRELAHNRVPFLVSLMKSPRSVKINFEESKRTRTPGDGERESLDEELLEGEELLDRGLLVEEEPVFYVGKKKR